MAKPKPPEPLVQINVRMTPSLKERLEAFAQRGGAKMNPTVIGLIEIGLERLGEAP